MYIANNVLFSKLMLHLSRRPKALFQLYVSPQTISNKLILNAVGRATVEKTQNCKNLGKYNYFGPNKTQIQALVSTISHMSIRTPYKQEVTNNPARQWHKGESSNKVSLFFHLKIGIFGIWVVKGKAREDHIGRIKECGDAYRYVGMQICIKLEIRAKTRQQDRQESKRYVRKQYAEN